MKIARIVLGALGAIFAPALVVLAANLPLVSGPQDVSQLTTTLNGVINNVNSGASPMFGLNLLDNGSFAINQRGTGERTGATTSGCAVASYVSDRWCIDTNVTSGAGFGQVVTSSPTPPPGSAQVVKVYRKTGALTQPVCLWQEVETQTAVLLQGKGVILSAQLAALAGAPTGMVVTGYVYYGTGTDEGLGALRSAVGMTASPAITPAWTGVGLAGSFTATPSTSFARASSGFITVPTTATELGVAFCFTPSTETAGTTDGFAIAQAQLERAHTNQTTAGTFTYLPASEELGRALRFFWQISDPAATVEIPSSCFVVTANTTVKCGVFLPRTMQAAPVTAVSTATSFGIVVTAGTAGTCTTLAATASSNSVNSIGLTCTTGGTIALGSATPLIGAGTAGTLNASADY